MRIFEGEFQMKILRSGVGFVFATFLLLSCASTYETRKCVFSATESIPAWNEQKLDEAFQLACDLGTTTLMVVTNGDVVKSLGDLETPLYTHSARKALLNALVGQHLGTGPKQINLESTLAELNINDEPNPLTPLQQQAKVLHLIKSVSGINHEAAAEGGLFKKEKDKRLGHKPNPPGTIWVYNNWDYNALTTIFEQETGLTVYQAFKSGIAEQLEMQDFNEGSVFYVTDKRLSRHSKAGFRMSARDLAKFGQLYLNKGKWNGRQIIPASWVERITSDYMLTGKKGLGSAHSYLWWVPVDRKALEMGIPEGTYFGSGFGSQTVVVIPAWDTVIVHQFDTQYIKECVRELIEKEGYNFRQALIYLYVCKFPLFSLNEYCRDCGWAANFLSDNNLVNILSKIIDAREDK
jgi:CubicO group peptidase (beta-lactamase class C family)